MNFKTLNIGCTQKAIFRSSQAASHFCWDESAGTVLIYDGYKYLYKYSVKDMKEEKRLNFAKISKEKHVQNVCHSSNFRVYFVLSDDLHMYVIKDVEFTYQTRFASDIKYAIYLSYLDDQNAFLAVTNEQVTYFAVNFKTNLFRATQYSSNITFECATLNTIQAHDLNCWNKGFAAQLADRIILTWDINDVYIFDGNRKLKSMHKLRQIGSRDSIICACLFIQSYDYLIVGYNGGEIKTWKVVPNNSSKKMLTYTFEAHARQVASLCRHATEPKIIVSAGLDHTIKFWDIDTFEYLFMFRAGSIYDEITLLSSSYFVCSFEQTTSVGYFTGSLKFLYAHDSDVVGVDKTYSNRIANRQASTHCSDDAVEIESEQELERIQLVLKNNSGLSLNCKSLEEYAYSRNVIVQPVALIYPPPICKKILSMVTCPFRSDSFFIHIETGGFCRYTVKKTDDNTVFYIEKIITPDTFLDSQGYPFAHSISIIKFLEILPPKVDLDSAYSRVQVDDSEEKHMSESEYRRRVYDEELMAFGSDKGSIIFVSLKGNFDSIYTRFSFHRDEILDMCVVKQKESISSSSASSRFLISFSREGILKVTNFTRNAIEQVRSIEIGSDFDFMLGTSYKLALTTIKGSFKLFSLRAPQGELRISEYEATSDHEKRILTIEVEPKRKLFLTAAKDNLIKIWSWKKLLLFQIKVPEKLTGATFVNSRADIAFFYSGRISLLDFKSMEPDIQEGIEQAMAFALTAKKANATIEEYFDNGMNLDFNRDATNQSLVALKSILNKPSQQNAMAHSNRLLLVQTQLHNSAELKSKKLNHQAEQAEDSEQQQQPSSPRSAATKRPPSQVNLSPTKQIDFQKLISANAANSSHHQQPSSQGQLVADRIQQRSSSKKGSDGFGGNQQANVFEFPSGSALGSHNSMKNGGVTVNHLAAGTTVPTPALQTTVAATATPITVIPASPLTAVFGSTAKKLHLSAVVGINNKKKEKQRELPELSIENDWSSAYRIEVNSSKASTAHNRLSLNSSSLRSSRNGLQQNSSSEKRTQSSSSGYQIQLPDITGANGSNAHNNKSNTSGSNLRQSGLRVNRNFEYSGRVHTTSSGMSPEVMKIYKPLAPNMEFVCITALPKQRPEKTVSAAEKYHRERILFQNRAMPRYATESSPFSKIIDYQPQASFVSVAIEPYNIQPSINPFVQARKTPYAKANRSLSGLNNNNNNTNNNPNTSSSNSNTNNSPY